MMRSQSDAREQLLGQKTLLTAPSAVVRVRGVFFLLEVAGIFFNPSDP